VRLGRQPAGSFFVPYREWAYTDDDQPQHPGGPALPPRDPGASPSGAGPEDATQAGDGPAEAGPPETSQAETSQAETRPADVIPADTSPADTGPPEARAPEIGPPEIGRPGQSRAETGPADVIPDGARPADTGPVGAHAEDTGPPGTRPQESAPAGNGAAPAGAAPASAAPGGAAPGAPPHAPGTPPESAGPPSRVPARQGPPPKPAPGSPRLAGPPATRPGGAPATRPGGMPATRRAAGPPARRPAAQPSWGAVLATTFRLWLGRRMEKTSWRAVTVLLLAAILFGAGALTITLTRNTPAANPADAGQRAGSAVPGGAALASVAKARKQAAAWVARQVNPDEVIGCDPMMCAALIEAHVQANRLLVLGPSRPDPLGSEILLDTATLRSQFGSRLVSVYAPVSFAAFGSGAARIEVRFVAPRGARAYLAELAADVAARRSAGREILRNHSIHAPPAARRQLAAGEVDARLLETLVALSTSHPVEIISFGTHQAGASPGVPLRSAEIAGAPGPGSTPAASVQELRAFLIAQQTTYHPSVIAVVHTASGRTVLRVGYPAPSLLGLLGMHG
jgi:hypothetical protein